MPALPSGFNKPLRPAVILTAGPLALGLLAAVASTVSGPGPRAPRDILFAFGAGAAAGLIAFAPIAGALAFRARMRRCIAANPFAVRWYPSILMSFAFGYLVASIRQHSWDKSVALSLLAIFIGALAKMICAIAMQMPSGIPEGFRITDLALRIIRSAIKHPQTVAYVCWVTTPNASAGEPSPGGWNVVFVEDGYGEDPVEISGVHFVFQPDRASELVGKTLDWIDGHGFRLI